MVADLEEGDTAGLSRWLPILRRATLRASLRPVVADLEEGDTARV